MPEDGAVLESPSAIEQVIVGFYKDLLGTNRELKVMDPRVMWNGSLVTRVDAIELVREISV